MREKSTWTLKSRQGLDWTRNMRSLCVFMTPYTPLRGQLKVSSQTWMRASRWHVTRSRSGIGWAGQSQTLSSHCHAPEIRVSLFYLFYTLQSIIMAQKGSQSRMVRLVPADGEAPIPSHQWGSSFRTLPDSRNLKGKTCFPCFRVPEKESERKHTSSVRRN